MKNLAPAVSGSSADGRVRIEASDGRLELSAYGQDSALTVMVPITSSDEVPLCAIVQGRLLVDFIGASDGSTTDVSLRDELVVVHSGGSDLEIPHYLIDSWFSIAHVTINPAEWPADAPSQLARVTHAASTDDPKPVLRGVALGDGQAVATDAHRLSMIELPLGLDEQIIVPASALITLERLHDGVTPITVCTDGQHLTFAGPRWRLTTNLIEGEFPAWQSAIPAPAEPAIRAYGDLMLTALHRIKLVAGKVDLKKIQIEAVDDEWLRIWADLPEVGRQEDIVQGTTTHDRVQFNLDHLTRAVTHLNKATVEIEMASPTSPAVIRADGYLALIMPIRG